MNALDLSRPWHELPIVVIDTETTGVGVEDAVLEVAAVRFEHGRITAEFSSLIDPERDLPEEATKVHGITAEMVKGKPKLVDVAGELAKVGRDAAPCAYNAPFDSRLVHAALAGTDCPAFDERLSWIDVYVIVASPRVDKYVKGSGRLKLTNVCARHGIDLVGAHRALGDARATGCLLWSLFDRDFVKPVSLARLLEHTDRMRAEHNRDFQAWLARQPKREAASG
jgi:DNA polymerase III epsilon subunit family exonuclease